MPWKVVRTRSGRCSPPGAGPGWSECDEDMGRSLSWAAHKRRLTRAGRGADAPGSDIAGRDGTHDPTVCEIGRCPVHRPGGVLFWTLVFLTLGSRNRHGTAGCGDLPRCVLASALVAAEAGKHSG